MAERNLASVQVSVSVPINVLTASTCYFFSVDFQRKAKIARGMNHSTILGIKRSEEKY